MYSCASFISVARPVTQPLNFEDIQARLHSVLVQCSCTYIQPFTHYNCACVGPCVSYVLLRKSGMRRGMLMTVLQQYAHEQDVWRGKPGERYMYMYTCACAGMYTSTLTCAFITTCMYHGATQSSSSDWSYFC